MAKNVSDFLLERLREWGIHRIYGYPGDGINGIMGALNRADGDPEFIQARHEEMAAFMACGHAKFTGEVGVCLATSGPGAIHLLNGLYDAKIDHQPVVAIVGQQPRPALGRRPAAGDRPADLFKDVAHEYVHMVTTPMQLPALVDRAVRIASAERTVTCLIVPDRRPGSRRRRGRRRTTSRSTRRASAIGRRACCRPTSEIRRAAGRPQRGREGRHPGRPGRARAPPTR